MKYRKLSTLVIGSGAAGLAAALRLESRNISDIAIYTEGLQMGTSINTGSDKQTYYKLGVCGSEPDSPFLLAQDLCRGGSMHGDIALIEASLSLPSFFHLVNLGVPFPHDVFGQYVGYKTDHDPKRRATSCGPYTSRDMCRAMIAEIQKRQIEVVENRVLIDLSVISEDGRKRCVGAIFIKCDTGTSASNENNDFLDSNFEFVEAENIIFATGGPGGLYEQSVYPQVHTGAIGVALRVGALARNLPESQFGLASTQFRWNVSGSYMQALPRFISIDEHGTEREFLRDYFTATGEMYDMIFLKGYQWPFSATHIPGSSLIDLFVSIEQEKGRRVFLDYRYDPKDFDLFHCNQTTREYLEKSQATGNSPIQRLKQLNLPAIEHYQKHGIDLYTEPLEIAVCAQH
ncbi:MAG: FAD-binding protein, partial [Thermoguttaceae bacterium]|nr:FAD-binding protein [Thermoguttaceae bacterium]